MIEKLRERLMVEFVLGKDASRQPRLNLKSCSLLFLIGSDTFFCVKWPRIYEILVLYLPLKLQDNMDSPAPPVPKKAKKSESLIGVEVNVTFNSHDYLNTATREIWSKFLCRNFLFPNNETLKQRIFMSFLRFFLYLC